MMDESTGPCGAVLITCNSVSVRNGLGVPSIVGKCRLRRFRFSLQRFCGLLPIAFEDFSCVSEPITRDFGAQTFVCEMLFFAICTGNVVGQVASFLEGPGSFASCSMTFGSASISLKTPVNRQILISFGLLIRLCSSRNTDNLAVNQSSNPVFLFFF